MSAERVNWKLPDIRHEPGLQAWLSALVAREPPMLAATARRLREWRAEPEASLDALAACIEEDASAAARVLRFANSALYQRSRKPLSSLDHAIAELGVDRVVELTLTGALIEDLGRPDLEDRAREEVAIALHCATQARALAALLDILDEPALRLSALFTRLGAIGCWAHMDTLPPALGAWPNAALQAGCSHSEVEWDLLGFRFTTLSDLLAQHWGLKESGRPTLPATVAHQRQTDCVELAQDLACAVAHRSRAPSLQHSIDRIAAMTGKPAADVIAAVNQGLLKARAQVTHWLSSGLAEAVFKVPPPRFEPEAISRDAQGGGGVGDADAQSSTFAELELPRGAEMEVGGSPCDIGAQRVHFCGAHPGRGILVMPDAQDWQTGVKGTRLFVRCFDGRHEAEFESTLQQMFTKPARCWMLSYPTSVCKRLVRAAHRVPTALQIAVSKPGDRERLPALGIDLSEEGMQIALDAPLGEPGQRLRLHFDLHQAGRLRSFERNAFLRYTRLDPSSTACRAGCIFEPETDRESRSALAQFISQRLEWLKCG